MNVLRISAFPVVENAGFEPQDASPLVESAGFAGQGVISSAGEILSEDRIAHIAAHGVSPEEVEEVCFGRPLVQGARSSGRNPVFYVLGQIFAGRYLFCVLISFPDGRGYPIIARTMTPKEQRRFNRRKGR